MNYQDLGVIRLFSFLDVPVPPPQNVCWQITGKSNNRSRAKISFLGRSVVASRLFYELYKGPIPEGLLVLHTCDNWRCCNPAHLYLGTQQDNMNDACNRQASGFKVPVAEVQKIRNGEYTCKQAMEKFGIQKPTFYQIRSGYSRAKL